MASMQLTTKTTSSGLPRKPWGTSTGDSTMFPFRRSICASMFRVGQPHEAAALRQLQPYPGALTAAHPSLPFGTKVRVTNSHTGRSVVVRINDRGPFVKGRVIDLSPAAAKAIGVGGIAQVSLSTN
jgi:rare lipoprotein A